MEKKQYIAEIEKRLPGCNLQALKRIYTIIIFNRDEEPGKAHCFVKSNEKVTLQQTGSGLLQSIEI